MKLPKKHVVRRYELTYLLPVSHTEAELKVLKESIAQFLTKNKATVEETQEWGKRKLAYAINHKHAAQTEAAYVHVVFTVEPAQIEKIELGLKLNESIIRYLLIVAEQLKGSKEAPKAKKAKAAGDAKTE